MRLISMLSAATLLVAGVTASTSALAWKCDAQAVGANPAYGYSKGYSNREDAEARALRECYDKGAKQCRIQYCGRDSGDQ